MADEGDFDAFVVARSQALLRTAYFLTQDEGLAEDLLTTYDLDAYVYRALRAGAAGFLLKATPSDRLVAGIETVAAGEALLSPSLTRRLIEQHVSGRRPATTYRPSSPR